ncbi:sensor histidine kinase [Paenibacillus sp. GYB003]|uniref:sensor histidine kinase n=1 Tax=Paenibacillus sp. GYB003 TaxID=2994392 RepID=UPI002F96935D
MIGYRPKRNRLRREGRTWSLSLRQKLLVTSVLCLIVPVLSALIATRYLTQDVLREQAATNAADSLEVVDRYVTNLVNKMIYVTNYLQFDAEVSSIVSENWNAYKSGEPLDVVSQVGHVKKMTQKLEAISFPNERMHMSVVLPNGTFFTNYPSAEYDPRQFRGEPWFPEPDAMRSYDAFWIGIHRNYLQYDKADNPYVITIARTIRNSSAEPLATIIVSLGEKHVSQVFSSKVSKQDISLIDSRGLVQSHRDEGRIGRPFAYMHLLPPEGQSGMADIDGETSLLVRHKLAYADWQLVSTVPYAEAVGKMTVVQQTTVVVQLVAFTAFLAVLVALISRLTKPMNRLGRVAAQVEAGRLDVRSHIRGPDEIGRLGRSFDQMLDRIEAMIGQIREEQTLKRKAELEMLQAQINPHFLFNVLNSIRMRNMIKGDADSAMLISSLAVLLRMTINRSNELIPLREEADIGGHYVKLMNFRHNEQIALVVSLSPEALDVPVPRFFMQPLIENAFLHGLEQSKGTIRIMAWLAGSHLIVRIEDDGKGMDEARLNALRGKLDRPIAAGERHGAGLTGIGVKNVVDRMKLVYGESFRVDIGSAPGEGTRFTLHIPVKEGVEADA